MNKVFVNACAAKEGGALRIIDDFLFNCDVNSFYYIVSPHCPNHLPLNGKWIKLKSSHFFTMVYTLFFSYFHAFFYGANEIYSFNNYNSIFSFSMNRKTYFHNLLILKGNGVKYKVIRFVLKYLNQKKCHYFFQTHYVKDVFLSFYGNVESYSVVKPNVLVDYKYCDFFTDLSKYTETINLVVPITDVALSHKNIELIYECASKCLNLGIKFFITADGVDFGNVFFIGKKCKDEFLHVIKSSDGVVVSSTFETFCLPIFEALALGVPAYVYDQPYVVGIDYYLLGVEGYFKFYDSDSFVEQYFNKNIF
jgi:glycosyltransferase involved in cell wall biosynthesis